MTLDDDDLRLIAEVMREHAQILRIEIRETHDDVTCADLAREMNRAAIIARKFRRLVNRSETPHADALIAALRREGL